MTTPTAGPAAGPATAPTSAPPRLRELDLLRFVAAGAVMLHHFAGVRSTVFAGRDAQKVYPELAPVAHFGYLGVELFFLISGFVILMSAWGRSPGDFAVSRIVRVYPAYWFSVVLSVVLYLLCDSAVPFRPDNPDPVQRLLPNLTLLQEGVGVEPLEVVFWTLWVELRFYVLIVLFACVGITYRRCVTFMVVWLLASVYAMQGNSELLKTVLFPEHAPFFIAGMAFFLIHRFRSNIALWLIVAACWALSAHYLVQNINPLNRWAGVHETVIPAVVTALYAIMAVVALGGLSRLSWRGFTFLGALTYPLYLLHEMVARAIVKVFFPHPILDRLTILPVITVSSLVTAFLVYKLVESPLQRAMRPRLLAAVAQIQRNGAAQPPPPPDPAPDEGGRPRHDVPAAPPASVP